MNRIIVLIVLFVVFQACSKSTKKEIGQAIFCCPSMDDFRWNYADMYNTSSLYSIEANGAIAAMQPCSPCKTSPNYLGMVTDLYPDKLNKELSLVSVIF